jgi:hypothetical protein
MGRLEVRDTSDGIEKIKDEIMELLWHTDLKN